MLRPELQPRPRPTVWRFLPRLPPALACSLVGRLALLRNSENQGDFPTQPPVVAGGFVRPEKLLIGLELQ